MNELTDELRKSDLQTLPTEVREELANYEEQIRKYHAGQVDETKMPDDPMPAVDAERLRLLLREIFTAAGGTHDDFGAYDRVMAEERRLAVLVTPARISPRG